jgi:hypothetical protein
MPVDPISIASLAITIAAAVLPFLVSTPDRTEFQTVPSFRYTHGADTGSGGFLGTITGKVESDGQIYGWTGSRQWIQHDEYQSDQYDQPFTFQGWLNS